MSTFVHAWEDGCRPTHGDTQGVIRVGKGKRLRQERAALLDIESPCRPGPPKDDGITPEQFADAEYLSIEWPRDLNAPDASPGICLSVKMFNKSLNPFTGDAKFDYMPTEDTIHPHALSFDPPLQKFGLESATGFQRYWEKLTYIFDLPDPNTFPVVGVNERDRPYLERFVRQSRRLAGFGLLNTNATLSARLKGREWEVKLVDPPSDESFLAASAVFRQLHNENESASFTNACNALFKVIKLMSEDEKSAIAPIVTAWRSARGKLMNNTIQTLTIMAATNATLDKPISFRNINPDVLIRQFNYGDSLHFDVESGLVDLMGDDERHEAYYSYAAMVSILGLSHMYCGFAVLLDRALGGVA